MNNLYFLQSGYILDICKYLDLSEDAAKFLCEYANEIKDNSQLSEGAIRLRNIILNRALPNINVFFEGYDAAFKCLVFISVVPDVIEGYRLAGASDEIILDTLSDYKIWIGNYYEKTGQWGLEEIDWLINHVRCNIIKLGRLQFIKTFFASKVKVFKNVNTEEVVLIPEGGAKYRADGLVDGTNHICEKNLHTSALIEKDGYVLGNTVFENGRAVKMEIKLDTSLWHCVLQDGERVLDIHIPAGGRMDYEECLQSLDMAKEFFAEYNAKAFICHSWLLNSWLKTVMPKDSNIIKFQDFFGLYPIWSDEKLTYKMVFKDKNADITKVKQDTYLVRKIVEHVSGGGKMYNAGGVIII